MAIETSVLGKLVEHLESQEKSIFAKPVEFVPDKGKIVPDSVCEPLDYEPEDLRRAVNELMVNDIKEIVNPDNNTDNEVFFIGIDGRVMTVDDILSQKTPIKVDVESLNVAEDVDYPEIAVKTVKPDESDVDYQEFSELYTNLIVKTVIRLEFDQDEPMIIGEKGFEGSEDETQETKKAEISLENESKRLDRVKKYLEKRANRYGIVKGSKAYVKYMKPYYDAAGIYATKTLEINRPEELERAEIK